MKIDIKRATIVIVLYLACVIGLTIPLLYGWIRIMERLYAGLPR
jgi:hypothetical protein